MEVRIAGKVLLGWDSVSINRSTEKISSSFQINTADLETAKGDTLPIFPDDKIKITDGNTVFLNGWVDKTSPKVGPSSHSLGASGRDLIGDIVDCTVTTGPKWSNIKLNRLAEALLEPYGIGLVVDADMGEAFNIYAAEPGEKVFECLNRACKMRGVMATNTIDGKVLLAKTGSLRADDDLILGANVRTATASFDNSKRYSEYTVVGQRPVANKGVQPAKANQVKAVAVDEEITRFRPLRIVAGQQVDTAAAQRRANWEMVTRAGKANSVEVGVGSWYQESGKLWEPNMLVDVNIPYLGINDEELLITSVSYKLSNGGRSAQISLVRADAFIQLPPSVKNNKGGKPDLWAAVRKDVRG